MSSRCPCRFSDHVDTILGVHKDPISSEKCWLDYIVRELSRVAAGKERGQEAVWGKQCQPKWWKSACPHPWKNPTANPKDNKDTLSAKFECLVTHLRNEGNLPSELQEEIALWEKGHRMEVFLMTSYSSLLGQVSNVHATLQMTQDKMHETGVNVQPYILDGLLSCLRACMDKVNAMKIKNGDSSASSDSECVAVANSITRCSDRKRHHDDSQSESEASQPTCKRFKLPTGGSTLSPPSSSSSPPLSPLSPCISPPQSNPEQRMLVLAALQKQLLVKNTAHPAAATPIAQHQSLQNTRTAACDRDALKGVAAPVDLVPPSVAISHNPDPMGESEIMKSYPDLFNLELDDVSSIDCKFNDFDDLLIKSPGIFSVSETNKENDTTWQVPTTPVSHPPNCSVFFSNNTVVGSVVSNVSSMATDGGSSQGVLLVSYLHSGLEDIDSIEEELVCESGYSSDGSASLRSSLDSTSPFPNLETFLESYEQENMTAIM